MNKKTPLEWKRYFESEEFEQEFTYDGKDLGCILKDQMTCFRVWAPTAWQVILNLYESGSRYADDLIRSVPMEKGEKGTWTVTVPSNLKNLYYTYTIHANEEVHETWDVYSRACGVNGYRSMIVDLDETDPTDWKNDLYCFDRDTLPVIYELHIKDFSFAKSSGIPGEFRGKYKAFTVKDSTLYGQGEKSTCLAYLKQLGITHVHLLPCYDFGSVDESGDLDTQFNWGYDPVNYNVPEGSYATDPYDGNVRIREFKEMVQSLHQAGLGVIMDVVYNHTYSLDSCFQKTVPYYYYRVHEDGTMSNGSVCGNDTASERLMYRKYMADSVCYWATEYHIDGFRFDLMGLHDMETMNEIRRRLDELPGGEHILMYGEPWAGNKTAMKCGTIPALKKNVELLNPRIAIFNDDTRDAIKGSVFEEQDAGFVNGKQGLKEKICSSVLAWCDKKGGYAPHDPGQTITYVSSHDNWTLWDKLNYTFCKTPDFISGHPEVLQANRFAAGICMTSLGILFMQAGEEAARTKQGIGDSYCSSPQLNALDWERMYEHEELIAYYKGMLSLRRQYQLYSMRSSKALDAICFHPSDQESVIFSVDTKKSGEKRRLWIIYAGDDGRPGKVRTVNLPDAKRWLLSDGKKVYKTPYPAYDGNTVIVEKGAVTVLEEAEELQKL